MTNIRIPESEYKERILRASRLIQDAGFDLYIVSSTDSDYANVRYFSGFWPLLERAGVVISPAGKAALMVGPESLQFARDSSKIESIFQLMEYRESADPSYPEIKPDTFKDVFDSLGVKGKNIKIGIGGYLDTTLPVLDGLKEQYPDARIIIADDIMRTLRSIKTDNEIKCLREAFRISELATKEVLETIRPGLTELQIVGAAQKVIYENGAEYEGLPMYVFAGHSSRHAISRSSHKVIKEGDIVQLNISARVDGYSACIGIPVSMGIVSGHKRDIVEFGLYAHRWTREQLKAGVKSSAIAKDYIDLFTRNGYGNNYLYGPCHGIGMIEVEAPWMESNSEYDLMPNMTFQIDTFVASSDFGIRWEKGIRITDGGCADLSGWDMKITEI